MRGILKDLLRGCGDCYNSNSTNSKNCIHTKESCLTNGPSQIKISPCASPEPSCSNPRQPVGRCVFVYKYFPTISTIYMQFSKIIYSNI